MNKFHLSFIGLIILLLMTSCQGGSAEPTPETCSYFHTGTFKYVGSEDVRIERTETQQIEYNLKGDGGYIFTDYYSIVWTTECEYYLTLDSTDQLQDLGFSASDTMWTKISSISRTGYSFIAVKDNTTYQGELRKTSS
jgi:hypothetical protein